MDKLHEAYTTSAAIHLLKSRYGLNAMGFRILTTCSAEQYQAMVDGKMELTHNQKARIYSAFGELTGRIKE